MSNRRTARILEGRGPVLSHSNKMGFGVSPPLKFWKTYMRFVALYCICCIKIINFFVFIFIFLFFSVFLLFFLYLSGGPRPLAAPLMSNQSRFVRHRRFVIAAAASHGVRSWTYSGHRYVAPVANVVEKHGGNQQQYALIPSSKLSNSSVGIAMEKL